VKAVHDHPTDLPCYPNDPPLLHVSDHPNDLPPLHVSGKSSGMQIQQYKTKERKTNSSFMTNQIPDR